MMSKSKLIQTTVLTLLLSGCSLSINKKNQNNACEYLYDNPYISHSIQSMTPSTKKQALFLAFIRYESNNDPYARPVKYWLIKNWVPWEYHSSAKGYAQSTEATWKDFNTQMADQVNYRHSYYSNIAFINWYITTKNETIESDDYFYEAYFLYHDGKKGYANKRKNRSNTLKDYAKKISSTAKSYHAQLKDCKKAIQWQNQWSSL